MLSPAELAQEAAAAGFPVASLEKAQRLLRLAAHEREFLTRLNDRGEIVPDLLTADSALQAKIAASPALQWKALRVRGRG